MNWDDLRDKTALVTGASSGLGRHFASVLAKALALEWARYGIRVNVFCPGYFETELNRRSSLPMPGRH